MTWILPTCSDHPQRILILGSCVSRDIFNADHEHRFVVADYFARSSIASVAAIPSPALGIDYERIASAFQRRTVQRDVSKVFLSSAVRTGDFDAILIDLIDERFDLYEVAPGALITLSSELQLSEFVTAADRAGSNWIASGSERHRELWRGGLEKLFSEIARLGLSERVIVNKVFWADSLEDGSPLPKHDTNSTNAANELLAWMYSEIAKFVPASQWMTFSPSVLKASPAHRWGIAPFHYSDSYYRTALEKLERLTNDFARTGAAVPEITVAAPVRIAPVPVQKFSFLMFKDGVLVQSQPYSDSTAIRFTTDGSAGTSDIVALILSFDPTQPHKGAERKTVHYAGVRDGDWISVEKQLNESFGLV